MIKTIMNGVLKLKEGDSTFFGVYFLGLLALVVYLLLFLGFFFHLFSHLCLDSFPIVIIRLVESLKLVLISVFISLPFAFSLVSFVIRDVFLSGVLDRLLFLVDRSPLLLFGLAFFAIFGERDFTLYLICSLIACSKLSCRWLWQSRLVPFSQVETAQSLGMDFWQTIKTIYVGQFAFLYAGHILSVVGFLLVVVTPFLCLFPFRGDVPAFFSLSFIGQLGTLSEQISLMALILFSIHGVRFWFDSRTGFLEEDYG